MNLVYKEDSRNPGLYKIVDDDTHRIKMYGCTKEYCEEYIEKFQPKYIVPKRRKKLYEYDLLGWDYVCSANYENFNIKANGILFYFNVLNDKERAYINSFKNTEILTITKEYAPELKYVGVAIYNKCIR